MTFSLQQAADAAGVNKSTVFRAIKAGKISATHNEHDQWLIEPAELHRVYPPATAGNRKLNSEGNDTHQSELAEASRSAALAELDVNLLRGTIEDLAIMRGAAGLASIITARYASRSTDSWSPEGRRFPPPSGPGCSITAFSTESESRTR